MQSTATSHYDPLRMVDSKSSRRCFRRLRSNRLWVKEKKKESSECKKKSMVIRERKKERERWGEAWQREEWSRMERKGEAGEKDGRHGTTQRTEKPSQTLGRLAPFCRPPLPLATATNNTRRTPLPRCFACHRHQRQHQCQYL